MRISQQFMLRQVADEALVIPVGEAALAVRGLISLSESGSLLYRKLQGGATGEELVEVLLKEYEIDRETAQADTRDFLNQMRRMGILIED